MEKLKAENTGGSSAGDKKEEEADSTTSLPSAPHTNGETTHDEKAPSTTLTQSRSNTKLSLLRGRKKDPAAKDDPFRFQGDGVDFKAKLIGVRDVAQARGDQMCQDAIQLCKVSVKNSGQHKQRILLNVSIDGLKIKDEKTQKVQYEFPVSKISFICRDVTDSRSFGFIFGSADGTHKFYAVKTAQNADQAVLSIRDMFQIVFEMKKKQIEERKESLKQEEKDQNENEVSNGDGTTVGDLLNLESELEVIQEVRQHLQQLQLQTSSCLHDLDNGDFPDPRQSNNDSGLTSSTTDAFGLPSFSPGSTSKAEWTPIDSSLSSSDLFGGDSFSDSLTRQDVGQRVEPWLPATTTTLPPPPPAQSANNLLGDPFDTSHVTKGPSSPAAESPLVGNPFFQTSTPALAPIPISWGGNVEPLEPLGQQLQQQSTTTTNAGPQPSEGGRVGTAKTLDEAFEKLVKSKLGQLVATGGSSSSVPSQPFVNGGQPAVDPFAKVRSPPKPTINDLRRDSPSLQTNTAPPPILGAGPTSMPATTNPFAPPPPSQPPPPLVRPAPAPPALLDPFNDAFFS